MAFVLVPLLAIHLLNMNISSAGPLVCLGLMWRSTRKGCLDSADLAKRLALLSVYSLLVGTITGGAVGYLSWVSGDARLVEVLPLFHNKIIWGVFELICSLVWLLGFWAWLAWRPPRAMLTRLLHGSLAVLSASNLLYHFPSLLTVMSRTASGVYQVRQPVSSAMFRELAFTPIVLAHSLHFTLASIAVSAVFLFWLARSLDQPQPFYVLGARLALLVSALQIPVGIWLLTVMPPEMQSDLLGANAIGTGLFVASLLLAFYLLQSLSVLALGEANEKLALRSGCLMLLTVLLMTGTLHVARS